MKLIGLILVFCGVLLGVDPSNCKGYKGPGGPAYAGLGGGANYPHVCTKK